MERSNLSRLLVKFEHFRVKYIRHRNFLIGVSFVVGILSALAAVILKVSVQFVEHQVAHLNDHLKSNWLSAIFPLIGVGLSLLLLTKVFRGRLTRGVSFIIESILRGQSRIGKQHVYGHMITSAITVALGGSVGLEAPIVATGAAIGSNAGKDLRLSYKDKTLLLACGVASGIAAIFNSPIAGIVFALEVLLIDFNIPFFIPLLISVATATVVSQVLYPDKFFFFIINGWDLKALPYYVVLGLLCGLVSVYTTYMVENVEGYFNARGLNAKTWLMGSIPLCLLIFILPGLYGEGYMIIFELLRGRYDLLTGHSFIYALGSKPWAIILVAVMLIFSKPISAALTTSAGGNGGIFAPSLVIGGLTGFVYSYFLNQTTAYTGGQHLRSPNFIITAMAGVLAGVMHAPLTAIFLLAEITGGYTLFVPLMIVTAMSYFVTRKYNKHSIYHKSLAERSILASETHDDDDYL